jgi:pilus assembly protein CpaF
MRGHQQSTIEDIEAEIGEAIDFVIHIERQPGRRAVREVVRLSGYDRRVQQFVYERVFPPRNGVAA